MYETNCLIEVELKLNYIIYFCCTIIFISNTSSCATNIKINNNKGLYIIMSELKLMY